MRSYGRLSKLVLAVLAAGLVSVGTASEAVPRVHVINRVFVYIMENTNYGDVIGNPDAPYLNELVGKFTEATNYYATGHASLDNYIAMTSGQPPNPGTSGDCFFYGTPFCLQDVPSIPDQLEAKGLTWKGYMDGMAIPCQHTPEGTVEESQVGYTPRHNPFMYYRPIIDDQARCDAHVVPYPELYEDMAARTVPNYSFLVPDSCHDGHDTGDHCEKGGDVAEADWWASIEIPRILADASWEDGGLLFVTFDESGIVGDDKPATVATGSPDFGGKVYMVLVSPNVTRGAKLDAPYNHYGMLKTVEDIFCLDYLAGASLPGTQSMIGAISQARCAPLGINAGGSTQVLPNRQIQGQQNSDLASTGASGELIVGVGVGLLLLAAAMFVVARRL